MGDGVADKRIDAEVARDVDRRQCRIRAVTGKFHADAHGERATCVRTRTIVQYSGVMPSVETSHGAFSARCGCAASCTMHAAQQAFVAAKKAAHRAAFSGAKARASAQTFVLQHFLHCGIRFDARDECGEIVQA
jgi:hypothetical protein